MRSRGSRLASQFVVLLLIIAGVLTFSRKAEAWPPFVGAWENQYPDSMSLQNVEDGAGAPCQVCHQQSTGGNGWNGYGWALHLLTDSGIPIDDALPMVEMGNADLDPGMFSNIAEILGDTQPGWTPGPNNTIYFHDGTTLENQNPPGAILGDLDPPIAVGDIAVSPLDLDFGMVGVGTTATLSIFIDNNGTGDVTVTALSISGSPDFDVSAMAPTPPFAVAPGATVEVAVDYSPSAGGAAMGTLAIVNDDPDTPQVDVSLAGIGAGSAFVRGDINDDGGYDVGDPIYLLANLFSGGPNPHCEESADANGDGQKDIGDAVYVLAGLFSSGPLPPPPFPVCGVDPDPPGLGCDLFDSCN